MGYRYADLGVTIGGSPSGIVAGNGMLFVFYPGTQQQTFFYICSADGSTWSAPVQTDTIGLSNAPSLVAYDSGLLCTMMSQGNSGELWWAAASEDFPWSLMTRVPNATMQGAAQSNPGTIVFNDTVYGFTQGSGNLLCVTFTRDAGWDTQQCVASGGYIENSPAPIVYNNDLWVFFQGSGASGTKGGYLYYITSSNGQSWSAPVAVGNRGMTYSPTAVVYNNYIYTFSTAWNYGNAIYYNVYNGSEWVVTNTQISVPGFS